MGNSTLMFAGLEQLSLSVLLEMLLKGGILLLVLWLASRWMQKAPAASRHLLWSVGMFALVILPVLPFVLPQCLDPIVAPIFPKKQHVPNEVVGPGSTAGLPEAQLTILSTELEAPPPPQTMADGSEDFASTNQASTLSEVQASSLEWWGLTVWAVGGFTFLIPLLLGFISLWCVARVSRRVRRGPLFDLMNQIRAELGIQRSVRLLLCEHRKMPMTWGVFRPIVLLPAEAKSWPEERTRAVLLHELAHIQRCDYLTHLLAQLARALHWANPLSWVAFSKVKAEQEAACDDIVLRSGQLAPDYAEHLLTVSVEMPSESLNATVAMASSNSMRLEQRLRAILDPTRNTRKLRHRETAFICTLSVLCLLVLGLPRLHILRATSLPNVEATDRALREGSDQDSLQEAWSLIRTHHVGRSQPSQLTERAIRGLVQGLDDPNSEYLDAQRLQVVGEQNKARRIGIGIWIREQEGSLVITSAIDDSPAAKCRRIFPGDTILAVDDQPIGGIDPWTNLERLMGATGTAVKITVRHRDGRVEEVELVRQYFKVPSVLGYRRGPDHKWDHFLNEEKTIGYAAIRYFSSATADDLRAVIVQLKHEGMKGMILDLRDSPGGLLESAIEVADLFLEKGTIVQIKGCDRTHKKWIAEKRGTLGQFPLIVLINEHTASAGEIVVGALGENNRAVLVGARTHGKGSVQSIFRLGDEKGAVKLTTAYYHLPSGRNIERRSESVVWGVDPNDGYYIPLTVDQFHKLRKAWDGLRALYPSEEWVALEPLTPESIASQYADPQLSGAFRSMMTKLATGNFLVVGLRNENVLPLLSKKKQLEEYKAELQKKINSLDDDLKDVDQLLSGEKIVDIQSNKG